VNLVCVATWVVAEGRLSEALGWLKPLTAASRAEEGCLVYQPYFDPADDHTIHIHEIYRDERAFEAHGNSEHFRAYLMDGAARVLSSRSRRLFSTLDLGDPETHSAH